jgi:transposase
MKVQLLIGDDWSQDHHTICFVHPMTGQVVMTFDVPQTPEGFGRVCAERNKLKIRAQDCWVGIETAHNLIVDYYLDHQYQVFVIAPSIVKGCRKRFGTSGAYTDESSAMLLADLLRTDRARFSPWRPHSPLIQQMLAHVRLIETLRREINRWTNRLGAALLRVNPYPLALFNELECEISLQFLLRYPTHEAVQALTLDDLKTFCREQHYTHPRRVPKLYAHLQIPTPAPRPAVAEAYADQVPFFAQTLLPLVRRRKRLLKELRTLFAQHPDHPLFDSLPGAGELLAPSLLAKFGDDRQRFPTPESVQALAGTCPVTKQSGKYKGIHFRKACDREFRRISDQFARSSLDESVWAVTYHTELQRRGIVGSHAIRCLANRWLAIIWRLWQDRVPYDEGYHLQQRALRRRPKS